jgi:hypothetical protein
MSGLAKALLIFPLAVATLAAQNECQSVPSSSGIDLAPPNGYLEICSKDKSLCAVLTAGYPASVTTLGYFVVPEEWEAYKRSPPQSFTRYLIAQLATSKSAADLAGFKRYLHAQQGSIPDHSRVPAVLESEGRVALGILGETDSSISFGTVMRLRPPADSLATRITLVATNSAVVAKGHLLSVYVFRDFREPPDIEAVEQLTRTWLACLARRN